MRKVYKKSVSFPEQITDEIDELAEKWFTNRSATLLRIYLEWKQLRAKQLPLAVETPDESTEEAPAAQMKANGCPPLVEA